MTRLHAVTSKGTRAASKMKKFQPAAKPNASSTYRPAKRMKGLDIGKYVTCGTHQHARNYLCDGVLFFEGEPILEEDMAVLFR